MAVSSSSTLILRHHFPVKVLTLLSPSSQTRCTVRVHNGKKACMIISGNALLIQCTTAGSNGVQIIPPHDSGIAASIESHLEIPGESWNPETIIKSSDLCIDQTEKLKEAYIETLARHPTARYVHAHL